jgi:2,5-diamino-6-(ribosylamino)-4(3H)-pyrimidinone 5'-phosphate reductase
VTAWAALRDAGHWSRAVGVHCASTPPRAGDHDEVVAGADRVDLRAALSMLADRFGVGTVRVDSGGGLTGALLGAGLVDEVSLLVHPLFAGQAGDRRWHGAAAPPAGALALVSSEALDGGLVWSRYRVDRAYEHP